MATIAPYNHTLKLLLNKEIVYTTLKVMLVNGVTAFNAAHTTLAAANGSGADQVSGGGWDVGGEPLASVAITVVNTNGAMLDAADITVTATGSAIGPAEGAIIYDDTHASDAPLWYIDFEETKQSDEGIAFKFTIPANGIMRGAWV